MRKRESEVYATRAAQYQEQQTRGPNSSCHRLVRVECFQVFKVVNNIIECGTILLVVLPALMHKLGNLLRAARRWGHSITPINYRLLGLSIGHSRIRHLSSREYFPEKNSVRPNVRGKRIDHLLQCF